MNVINIVTMDEISPQLVINFDQTAVNFVPIPFWTMEKEGAKRVYRNDGRETDDSSFCCIAFR